MLDYYQQKQIIARVDKNGKILGRIEKWEAHKKGILHKALTVALIYKGQFVIQHRKHPAFDGVFDITSSSHQLFVDGQLQTSKAATFECLKREWNLNENDLNHFKSLGSIYYKAKDPNSIYTEHEMCEILLAEVKKLPTPNYDFAYGFSLLTKDELRNVRSRTYANLAPWAKKMIEEDLL
ncbi:MAG: hypothetical protein HY426_00895 [Candidatus Levybacteria bacterium]|nr:hypothetical protein [Candidatus Levybacteria bacterium]